MHKLPLSKEEALAHYDRMFAWVRTQLIDDYVDMGTMQTCIGESWYASCCCYCHTYYFDHDNPCSMCPLNKDRKCCNGLWDELNNSRTWKEWLQNVWPVRDYIEKFG